METEEINLILNIIITPLKEYKSKDVKIQSTAEYFDHLFYKKYQH